MKGVYQRITGDVLSARLSAIKSAQSMPLEKKIDFSIRILKSIEKPICVLFSGGQDSQVILKLVQMITNDFFIMYNDTTIGAESRLNQVRNLTCGLNYIETRPNIEPVKMWNETGFYPIFGKRTFTKRKKENPYLKCSPIMCCYRLKEQPANQKLISHKIKSAIWGNRADESNRRLLFFADNGAICRPKKYQWAQVYPIFHWTKKNVIEFLGEKDNQISFEAGCLPCCTDITKYPNNISRLFLSDRKLFDFYMRSGLGEQILIASKSKYLLDYALENNPEIFLRIK